MQLHLLTLITYCNLILTFSHPYDQCLPTLPYYKMFTCFSAKKTCQFSHTVLWCSSAFPPLSETLCFSSCHFKARPVLNTRSALIGQLYHAWARNTSNNKAAVLNQFLRANLGINYANVWWPHRIKGYIFGYICVPVFMIITICECTICEDIKVRPKQSTFDNLYWQINVSETLC